MMFDHSDLEDLTFRERTDEVSAVIKLEMHAVSIMRALELPYAVGQSAGALAGPLSLSMFSSNQSFL